MGFRDSYNKPDRRKFDFIEAGHVLTQVTQAQTVNFILLDNNESAFSIAVVPFAARGGELTLVVGTAQDTFLAPRSCTSGFLRTYRFVDDGRGLKLLHKVCDWYSQSNTKLTWAMVCRQRQTTSPSR